MTTQSCAHGWIAEEYREDAVVYVYRRFANSIGPGRDSAYLVELVRKIRCTTWERAREWVDVMQSQGYRTQIRWEVAR